jgi:hypothetical protein
VQREVDEKFATYLIADTLDSQSRRRPTSCETETKILSSITWSGLPITRAEHFPKIHNPTPATRILLQELSDAPTNTWQR